MAKKQDLIAYCIAGIVFANFAEGKNIGKLNKANSP